MTKPHDVARHLVDRLEANHGWLEHEEAVTEIERHFGEMFLYENENGNQAIARSVLKEFRRLTEKTVVWSREGKAWRYRDGGDDESSRLG